MNSTQIMKFKTLGAVASFVALALAGSVHVVSAADPLAPALQTKVDAKIKEIEAWAADPAIVGAVKAANTTPPAEGAGMTQEKWKGLSILDPLVRSFSKNSAGEFLKSKKGEVVTEAFISAADGTKVAFISKPTNWSHKGKEKHEAPMTGKTWQGQVETDESTGARQLQVSVPVLDAGKPAGSLVVGLSVSKIE
jgi:hypothetical protein